MGPIEYLVNHVPLRDNGTNPALTREDGTYREGNLFVEGLIRRKLRKEMQEARNASQENIDYFLSRLGERMTIMALVSRDNGYGEIGTVTQKKVNGSAYNDHITVTYDPLSQAKDTNVQTAELYITPSGRIDWALTGDPRSVRIVTGSVRTIFEAVDRDQSQY